VILYFLRHGRAGEQRAVDDEGRELTSEGVAALRAAIPLWRRLNLRPDLVLSSPLVRARQTAELFCAGLDAPAPLVDETLGPGADWGSFARAMAGAPDARRVLFVGHEPDLSSTVALLSGAASVRLRPGGLACLEFPGVPEPGAGEIAWLLDPDLYAEADR
jgi:phosphohistidine phosphatase